MSKSGTISIQSVLGGDPVVVDHVVNRLLESYDLNTQQQESDQALPQDTVSPLASSTTCGTKSCVFNPLVINDILLPNLDPVNIEKVFDLDNDLQWLEALAAATGDMPDVSPTTGAGPSGPAPGASMALMSSLVLNKLRGDEVCAAEPVAKRPCPSPTASTSSVAVSPAYSGSSNPASPSSLAYLSSSCAASSPSSGSDSGVGGDTSSRKRKMNNDAAKKSRQLKRTKDQENDRVISDLRAENEQLRAEEAKLKRTLERAKLKIQAALCR